MYCALVMLQRVTFLALAINFWLAVPMYKSTPATCSRSLMPFVPLLNTIDIDDKKSPSIFELHLYFSQKDAFWLIVPMYKSTPATCSRSLMPFVPLLNTIDIDDKKSPSISKSHLYFSQKDAFWLIVPVYKSTPVCKKRALF